MWENVSSAIVSLSGIEMQIFRSDLVWIYTTDESCGYASFLKLILYIQNTRKYIQMGQIKLLFAPFNIPMNIAEKMMVVLN